ncbi:MAG: hypothetical protein JW818_07760 [Pirellulales bacterium]|nr:hypothetical protein [Pirellulales bacterium]
MKESEPLNTFTQVFADFPIPEDESAIPTRELADLLAIGLEKQRYEIVNIEWMDYEHVIEAHCEGVRYGIGVGLERLASPVPWNIMPRLLDRLPKDRLYEVLRPLLFSIHEVISHCDHLHKIRWYPGYEDPDTLTLTPSSRTPLINPDVVPEVPWLHRLLSWITHHTFWIVGIAIILCIAGYRRVGVVVFLSPFALSIAEGFYTRHVARHLRRQEEMEYGKVSNTED